jgi:hypothetical protein
MLRRSLLALAAAVLLLTASCSDGDAGTGADPKAGASADTATVDSAVGGSGNGSDFCAQIAERKLTDDPEDAVEHYAKLRAVAPEQDLREAAAVLEQAYRELADAGAAASAIEYEGRTRTALRAVVQYQKDICFG